MSLIIRRFIAVHVFLCLSVAAFAQQSPDKRDVRSGNRYFKKEKFSQAEINYRKGLVKDSLSVAANYNLANTLYKKSDWQQAAKYYEAADNALSADEGNADVCFGSGNAALQEKNWNTAVEAFKRALLLNPDDMDAKESYIYAKKMLEDQQNQQDQNQQNNQQDQNQSQQDNKDKNKDNNENNQDQQQNQNNDQDRDNQDQNRDQNQQDGSQPQLSPQAAEQIMQALEAKEKDTQEKAKKAEALKMKSRQKDKNW